MVLIQILGTVRASPQGSTVFIFPSYIIIDYALEQFLNLILVKTMKMFLT